MRALPSLAILGLALTLGALPAGTARADFAGCAAQYADVGLPERLGDNDAGEVQERCLKGFALLYNRRTRTPDWVIERLTVDSFRGEASRSKSAFVADTEIDESGRAEIADYEALWNGQRFDRGHQAPAADHTASQEQMNETFLLSNMAPQVGIGFNRYIWAYLEKMVRGWVMCGGRSTLYVITGPIYGTDASKVLGPNRIAIPDAFYKIVYDPEHGRAVGLVLENRRHEDRSLEPYRTSIRDVERMTGIDFLTALDERRQNILEANANPLWAYDRSCDARH